MTPPTGGPRLAAALSTTVADPATWLLGAAGFLARGGVILMALPIATLPSPVGIASLIGPRILDTGRLAGPALAAAAMLFLILVALFALALFIAAWIDAVLFERHLADPETGRGRAASPTPPSTGRPIGALVGAQVAALLPALAAGTVTLGGIVAAVRQEILLPGDLAVPLALRALSAAGGPVLLLGGSLLLAEALNGVLSRRVLLRGRPRGGALAAGAVARRLVGIAVTAFVGWVVALTVLLPSLAFLLVAWEGVRDAWLAGAVGGFARPGAVVLAVATTLLFVALWIAVLALAGLVSAFRASLWTERATWAAGDWTAGGD